MVRQTPAGGHDDHARLVAALARRRGKTACRVGDEISQSCFGMARVRLSRGSLSGLLGRAGLHKTLIDVVILIFALVMAADQIGINVGAALAGIGVVGIASDPPPDLVVTELGSSSVNTNVRVWIDEASREQAVFFRVMEARKLALDEAGIEIPYHHLQLFIENIQDPVWQKAAAYLNPQKQLGSAGEMEAS